MTRRLFYFQDKKKKESKNKLGDVTTAEVLGSRYLTRWEIQRFGLISEFV